jgi:hypothetical protein
MADDAESTMGEDDVVLDLLRRYLLERHTDTLLDVSSKCLAFRQVFPRLQPPSYTGAP